MMVAVPALEAEMRGLWDWDGVREDEKVCQQLWGSGGTPG